MPPSALRLVSIIWLLLLIPWLVLAGLSRMIFITGYTLLSYVFVWSVLTYPVVLALAFLLKKRNPTLIFLPVVNFLLPIAVAVVLDAIGVHGGVSTR